MTNPVEREVVPKDVELRPEQIEVPEHIEKAGVQPTQTQFQQRVQDDDGTDLVQSPAISVPTIEIPNSEAELEQMSKKKPTEASTWFGIYWLRMIRKALHYGWKVVLGNKAPAALSQSGGDGNALVQTDDSQSSQVSQQSQSVSVSSDQNDDSLSVQSVDSNEAISSDTNELENGVVASPVNDKL